MYIHFACHLNWSYFRVWYPEGLHLNVGSLYLLHRESAQDVIAIFSPEHSTPQNMYAQSRGPIHSLEFASPKMPLYAAAQAQENGRKNPHSPLLAILESRQFTVETGAGMQFLSLLYLYREMFQITLSSLLTCE